MARRANYEGSKQGLAEDKKGARRRGVTLKAYEKTAQDKAEDKRGQAKLGKKK